MPVIFTSATALEAIKEMRDFLILGLMPYFAVREWDINDFHPEAVFEEYIQGKRDFGAFMLRPVGVQFQPARAVWEGWSMSSPEDGMTRVSARQSLYQLTVADDRLSEGHFTDCLLALQALTHGFAPEDITLVPMEAGDAPESRVLPVRRVAELYCQKFELELDVAEQSEHISSKRSGGAEWDDMLWNAARHVIDDEQVIYALLFLRGAFEHFMFYGDDYVNAILYQEKKAAHIKESVDIENSIHNCYKVMEAIYGGTLATDWSVVESRFLERKGVDLRQLGGFRLPWGGNVGKERQMEKLKRLRFARDDRAAHGRIHADRRSTYYELMDYQVLAVRSLREFIKHKYPTFPML